ncbi:MAG TPA: aldehyde dehydrogenase [Allosphingosinicella sp.]|nr:aldehyde dehydrogenase [Allosphingosinicella sp.]
MTLPRERDHFFIGGAWRAPATSARIEVVSPFTEDRMGGVPGASPADMDVAIAAARKAFDRGPWPFMSIAERAELLGRIAAYLRDRGPDIARLVSDEMGGPMGRLGRAPGAPADMIDRVAALAVETGDTHRRQGLLGEALIRHEPVGVVAAITPWNGPLTLLLMKFAPALAMGCTIVAKPSPEAPLDAFVLADACDAAGLPPGVFNLVPGGREAGEYLVSHPGVDKVAFTGSTAAGRRIAEICGRDLRRCALELGGKSAAVALDDADPALVAAVAVPFGLAFNNGQACAALTRILVPRARQAEFVAAIEAEMAKLVVGDPADPATHVGPVVAARQRRRIEGLIASGREEGARLVRGGDRPAFAKGWFVAPTLFADVDNAMAVAREEIFGPVGVVIPYDGGDEAAVAIANDTPYGLAGAVFSADPARAYEAAKRVRAGTMGVNTFAIDPGLPFGGYKASGIGRENGVEGLRAFTETKVVLGAPAGAA